MRKFRKVLNFKFIAIAVSMSFLFTSAVHACPSKYTLRVPLGQKPTYERLIGAMHKGKATDKFPRLVAHADIHGELDGFKENLRQARLIDENDNWIGGDNVLVQVGDVIDRGPKSREAYEFLDKLQEESRKAGGDVIRLAGNHELRLLQGSFAYVNFENPGQLKEKLKKDVLEGKVKAAYVFGNRLFVHGGLRSKIREMIKAEIAVKKRISVNKVRLEDIAERLNEILIEAVSDDDFNHAIFQADATRGGRAEVAGIFWNDFDDLMMSRGANEIKQVVGHTPEKVKGARGEWSDAISRIDIDAGLLENYGGNNAFLVIEGNELKIISKNIQDQWQEEVLGDFLEEIPAYQEHEIITRNVAKIFSDEFKRVLSSESISGSAGIGHAGVNGAIDASGKIVAFGNPEVLPSDVRDKLRKGELYEFGIRVKVFGKREEPDYEVYGWSKATPLAARAIIEKTVQEANREKAEQRMQAVINVLSPDEVRLVVAISEAIAGDINNGKNTLANVDTEPLLTPEIARIYLEAREGYETARNRAASHETLMQLSPFYKVRFRLMGLSRGSPYFEQYFGRTENSAMTGLANRKETEQALVILANREKAEQRMQAVINVLSPDEVRLVVAVSKALAGDINNGKNTLANVDTKPPLTPEIASIFLEARKDYEAAKKSAMTHGTMTHETLMQLSPFYRVRFQLIELSRGSPYFEQYFGRTENSAMTGLANRKETEQALVILAKEINTSFSRLSPMIKDGLTSFRINGTNL